MERMYSAIPAMALILAFTCLSNAGADSFKQADDRGIAERKLGQWALTWEGSGQSMALDDKGDIYVVGCYSDGDDIVPGPRSRRAASNGVRDAYLVKINSSGEYVWDAHWGGSGWDDANDVAVDGDGNIYVTGGYAETVDFDPGDGVEERTAVSWRDGYLSKFSPDGEFRWVFSLGEPDKGSATFNAVACDNVGSIFVGGGFSGIVDFDPGQAVIEHESSGTNYGPISSACLLKLNPSGGLLWAHTWGTAYAHCECSDIIVDEAGNAYTCGTARGGFEACPMPGSGHLDFEIPLSSWVGGDSFLVKFDSSGLLQWSTVLESAYFSGIRLSRSFDDSGGFHVITSRTMPFDRSSVNQDVPLNSDDDDICLYRYSADGGVLNEMLIGAESKDEGLAVDVDSDGNVYVAGAFTAFSDIDPGAGEDMRTGGPYWNYSVEKLDSEWNFVGAYTWAISFSASSPEPPPGDLAVDEEGNVYVLGYVLPDAVLGWEPEFEWGDLPDDGGTVLFKLDFGQ